MRNDFFFVCVIMISKIIIMLVIHWPAYNEHNLGESVFIALFQGFHVPKKIMGATGFISQENFLYPKLMKIPSLNETLFTTV